MKTIVALFLACFATALFGQGPPSQRNDFTTNGNPSARGVVTNIAASLDAILNFPRVISHSFDGQTNFVPGLAGWLGLEGQQFYSYGDLSNNARITNGYFEADMGLPSGKTASYIYTTVPFPMAEMGIEYEHVLTNAGSAFLAAINLSIATNSMFLNGAANWSQGFHCSIAGSTFTVDLITNGLASAVTLGTFGITDATRAMYGQRQQFQMIFPGNNTIQVIGNGWSGFITNSRIDLYTAKGTNATYCYWEFGNFSGSSTPLYTFRTYNVWAKNLAGYRASYPLPLAAGRSGINSLSISNSEFGIGNLGPVVSGYWLYTSNGIPIVHIDNKGRAVFGQQYGSSTANNAFTIFGDAGTHTLAINRWAGSDFATILFRGTALADLFSFGLLNSSVNDLVLSGNGTLTPQTRWHQNGGVLIPVAFTNTGVSYLSAIKPTTATASRAAVVAADGTLTNAAGTPDGTKFLRDDNTYAVPSSSASTNSGGFGQVDTTQFATNGNTLVAKNGGLYTNIGVRGITLPDITPSRVVMVNSSGVETNVTSAGAATTEFVLANGTITKPNIYEITNSTGTAVTADWNGPARFRLNLSGTTTISFTNCPAAGSLWKDFILELYATTTVPATTIANVDSRAINFGRRGLQLVNSETNIVRIVFDGTNFIGSCEQDLTTGSGPYALQTNPVFYAETQLSGIAYTNQTIAGVGGANTNFTGQASDTVVYIDGGTTNVNFVAIMPGASGVSYFPLYIITNLTTTSRTLSFSSATNRLINLQQYDGITLPITLSNKHTAYVSTHLNGSNAAYAIKVCTNGF